MLSKRYYSVYSTQRSQQGYVFVHRAVLIDSTARWPFISKTLESSHLYVYISSNNQGLKYSSNVTRNITRVTNLSSNRYFYSIRVTKNISLLDSIRVTNFDYSKNITSSNVSSNDFKIFQNFSKIQDIK